MNNIGISAVAEESSIVAAADVAGGENQRVIQTVSTTDRGNLSIDQCFERQKDVLNVEHILSGIEIGDRNEAFFKVGFRSVQSTKGKRATSAIKGKYGKGFTGDLVKRTRAMLTALDAAVVMEDLRFPPGNHLEELKGDRAGQHSVRINGQWRICFVWTPNSPADVEIVDYH